jgi:hypothetical protein
VRLIEIDRDTEATFFRCLHDEAPENTEAIALRRRWYDKHKQKGLRAKVLLREDNAVVGLCQYMPIGASRRKPARQGPREVHTRQHRRGCPGLKGKGGGSVGHGLAPMESRVVLRTHGLLTC